MDSKKLAPPLPRGYRIARAFLLTVLFLFAGWIAYLFIASYVRSDINTATTAKPIAKMILPYIKEDGGEIVYSYNRFAGGFLNKVRVPSFEYYVLYRDTGLEQHANALADGLRELGYDVRMAKYVAGDESSCSRYGDNPVHLAGDRYMSWDDSPYAMSEYCREKTGVGDRELLGSIENEGWPYYTLYGVTATHEVFAEITDRIFHSTSNDFWRDEFADEHGLQPDEVPGGSSIAAIHFNKLSLSASR